jgi:dipeptidyl aminopeptidase/acylaminoacyl peptidase
MRYVVLLLASTLALGCGRLINLPVVQGNAKSATESRSLLEAKRDFKTKLLREERDDDPLEQPPTELFRVVHYDAPVGKLAAYVSNPPSDGKKHPAIIWIFGGFSNGIGATAWEEARADNDQSASAFREAGIVTMYPALRGGSGNPGFQEGFLGEVDDVLAAREYLAKQDFVDPERIYLGGHSTGGTLVLLAAACSKDFRAVFSFGPVEDPRGYGQADLPYDVRNHAEAELRAPIAWLHSIGSPVFVLEGDRKGNAPSLLLMKLKCSNPLVRFHVIRGGTHFNILQPYTRLVAQKIKSDTGSETSIAFSEGELKFVAKR